MKKIEFLLICLIGLAFPFTSLGQPTIQFVAGSYTVAENASAITLTLQRTGDTTSVAGVDYATADGTAANGLKYTAVFGTVAFGANETNKSIVVPILNNGLIDGTKTFRVLLSNPVGALLGARASATITITDNDSPLKVEFTSYEALENEVTVLIGVIRADDGDFAVTVDYATTNVTALAGEDYLETKGRLNFSSGETLKLVSIPILNGGIRESNETLRFTLADAIGVSLGTQKSATITLKDNDPGVQFATATYYIQESENAMRATVRRGNDMALGSFTVNYSTVDGTAVAGQDYVATSGTLSFAADELTQSLEVPIINDGTREADQNFRVVLSNASGGANLGPVTNLTVILCDSTGMTPNGFAAIQRDPGGVVKLTFTGAVSQRFQPYFDLYPVEVSTNLVDWQALALLQRTNSATNELAFVDPSAGASMRFYRVPTNHYTAAYPKPTGPYPVGRIDRVVTDPIRRNRYGISSNCWFAMTVWYPAAAKAGQRPARWFEEAMARDTSPASYWALFESTSGTLKWLDRLPYLWTYSFSDAPLAEVPGKFPVVLFSPGATANRRHFAEVVEALASHGYVTVAIDPYDAYDISWPDGFYRSGRPDDNYGLFDRARDLVVVLDELTNWNQTDARFAGRLDLDKVGAMGVSWGGPTVAEWAQQDSRCKAVVLLDPGGSGGNLQGFSKPSLGMHSLELNSPEVFNASRTNAVWLQISNTDHASFGNYLLYSGYPLASNREAFRTINAYALSFFNKFLKTEDDRLHEGPSPDFPRVINLQKK
jgi:dienelactone hydrolase